MAVILAMACSGDTKDRARATRVRHSYALTPAGTLYRVFTAGPITRGANTTVGLQVAYLASSSDPAQLAREADELLRAFGPEMLLTPERTLEIQARYGVTDTGSRPEARSLTFERKNGGWVRAAQQKNQPPPATGASLPPDESSFPFVRAKVDAAAEEALHWLGLVDAQLPAAVDGLTQEFTAKLTAAPGFWPSLLASRQSLGMPGTRTELYRMQSFDRNHPKRPPGDSVMIQYQATTASSRVLERVTMLRVGERWAVAGYVYQPIPSP